MLSANDKLHYEIVLWGSEQLTCRMHASENRVSHHIDKQFLTTKIVRRANTSQAGGEGPLLSNQRN